MTWTRITDDPATLPPMCQVVVAAFPDGNAGFFSREATEDGTWLWARCYDVWFYASRGCWNSDDAEQDSDHQSICMWHPLPVPTEEKRP